MRTMRCAPKHAERLLVPILSASSGHRARAAFLCRHIASAVIGFEAAGSVWHEATLPPLSDNAFDSLSMWAARRSNDLQRLRLSTVTTTEVGQHLR
jgi:hypothetical protein